MKIHPNRGRLGRLKRGFTLVELVLAMIISGLLVTSIMRLADSTIKSTQQTVQRQNAEITQDAFFTLMRRHFEGLPGNCRIELTYTEQRGQYLSEMIFQNVPTAFNWGGMAVSSEALRIRTVPLQDGEIDIVLDYFDEQILDADGELAELGIEPIASITLLQGLRLFEWRVLDGRNQDLEWQNDWEVAGRKPTQVELHLAFGQTGDVVRRVFWIPSKVNPVTLMLSLGNNVQGNQGGNGGVSTPNPNIGGAPGGNRPTVSPERPSGSRPPGEGGNRGGDRNGGGR
ncbi:MAG: PulJ/GspJ family protein [Verrucomicrobiaceae bacterium]